MLTLRSSVLLAGASWLLVFGVFNRHEPLALLSLSIVVWLLLEWLFFLRIELSRSILIGGTRTFDGKTDQLHSLTIGREYQVSVNGKLPKRFAGYRVLVQDTIADTFAIVSGSRSAVVNARRDQRFQINYRLETPIVGQANFPGIQIEVSDYYGFFRTEFFVPLPQTVTVLPFLIRPQTTTSVLKRNNVQRHIGHHRHTSAGVSSELLGIRDYRIGDPPRTIAWKPTARLGKLMTCEFESEVPIRTTLIADLASYQFYGRPGPAPADRSITAAASIAKLLLADRDPVALVTLGDEKVSRIGFGSGERQLTRILQSLLSMANPSPPLDRLPVDKLIVFVFENASRRFPHLFDEGINRGPAARKLLRTTSNRSVIRRSVSVVLEHLLGLAPGSSTRLQFDDAAIVDACYQFALRFGVDSRCTTDVVSPIFSPPNRWKLANQRMTKKLCDHLLKLRMGAKDNELFVVLAPEPSGFQDGEKLESAVKTIIAAGHRMFFVMPTVPLNKRAVADPVAARVLANAVDNWSKPFDSEFRQRMTRLGATCSTLSDPSLMQLVATEVGILRSSRSSRKTLRAR